MVVLLISAGCSSPAVLPTLSPATATISPSTEIEPTPTVNPVEVVWVLTGGDVPFSYPADVAVSDSGLIYISNGRNNLIQKFDLNGNFISSWGGMGDGHGQFDFTNIEGDARAGLAIDGSGNVYVTDYNNHRVQKFDQDGNFLFQFGSAGAGKGEFLSLLDVAVAENGNIYVIDDRRDDIQVFDAAGTYLFKWGKHGQQAGEFYNVGNLALDQEGNVYVADYQNQRIQIFDSQGNFLRMWGSLGDGDYEFESPSGIAVDSVGNIYVANQAYH
ncbi:MAG TPA: 6-bladed beta-propeller, partial [Terriglobales bacterium]|nr:6-bladed beta-propeller [Terriglobales bacterium]